MVANMAASLLVMKEGHPWAEDRAVWSPEPQDGLCLKNRLWRSQRFTRCRVGRIPERSILQCLNIPDASRLFLCHQKQDG